MVTKVQQALTVLEQRAEAGVTWRELGWPHGSASRVLSDLHRTGACVRLTEQRGSSSVYVLPEHVRGRDSLPQGRLTLTDQALAAALADASKMADRVEAVVVAWCLDEAKSQGLRTLGVDLRRAIGRVRGTDPTTLPLPSDA